MSGDGDMVEQNVTPAAEPTDQRPPSPSTSNWSITISRRR